MKSSHLFFKMKVNVLPMHAMSAIGRKFEVVAGSSTASLLPITLMVVDFQEVGTAKVDQQQLKRQHIAVKGALLEDLVWDLVKWGWEG